LLLDRSRGHSGNRAVSRLAAGPAARIRARLIAGPRASAARRSAKRRYWVGCAAGAVPAAPEPGCAVEGAACWVSAAACVASPAACVAVPAPAFAPSLAVAEGAGAWASPDVVGAVVGAGGVDCPLAALPLGVCAAAGSVACGCAAGTGAGWSACAVAGASAGAADPAAGDASVPAAVSLVAEAPLDEPAGAGVDELSAVEPADEDCGAVDPLDAAPDACGEVLSSATLPPFPYELEPEPAPFEALPAFEVVER
jgi:hypothetical protein